MAKIKQKINITDHEDTKIRRQWDSERSRLYFSITDVIAVLTESVDARNYWKALKSRLKITHNQLVMDCNQLKMKSSDGKSYMVDVADGDTIIKIIQIIAPYNVPVFRVWFEHVDVQNSIKNTYLIQGNNQNILFNEKTDTVDDKFNNELSPTFLPPVNILENKNEFTIQIMLPGVEPSKIIIAVNMKNLTVKGERILPQKISNEDYFYKELNWGEFYRKIQLPALVDVDQIQATEFKGLITIKLIKIDLDKNRFLKIKSLE